VLIDQGFLSFEDVAVLTPAELMEMGVPDEDTAQEMIYFADEEAARVEKEARFGKPREAAQAAPQHAPAPAPQPANPQTGARQAFENLFAPQGEGEQQVEEMPAEEGQELPPEEGHELPPEEFAGEEAAPQGEQAPAEEPAAEANVSAPESVSNEEEIRPEDLPPG